MKKNASFIVICPLLVSIFFPQTVRGSQVEFFKEVNRLIDGWDINNARKMLHEYPEKEDSHYLYLDGKIHFFMGNYEDSVDLFKKAGTSRDDYFFKLAEASQENTRGFKRIEDSGFIIALKPGKDEVLLPYLLQTLKGIRSALKDDLGFAPEENVVVEIYPDINSFVSVTPLTPDSISTTGTVAICLHNRILITSPRLYVRGYSWLDTVSHEYVHYVLTKLSNNSLPLWLQEGIAKFEEARWRSQSGGEIDYSLKSVLKEAVDSNDLVSFEEMGTSFARLRSARRAALAFAQVVTMVEYIISKRGMPALIELIKGYSTGKSEEENFIDLLNMNRQEFMTAWLEYAKKLVSGAPKGMEVFHPVIKGAGGGEGIEAENITLQRARDFLVLGDIMRDRGRLDAAVVEYRKAVNLSPGTPHAVNKLALVLLIKKQYKEAGDLLKKSLALYPDFQPTHINLAAAYNGLGEDENQMKALVSANAINPFDPHIHHQLYLLYKKSGDEENAKIEENAIRILSDRDGS